MKKTRTKLVLSTMIGITMVFAVSCQSVEHGSASERLYAMAQKNNENRVLSNRINNLRAQEQEARAMGDYYTANAAREELKEVEAKLRNNGGRTQSNYDYNDSTENDNYRYRTEANLMQRTNAGSTYANGELTTSSKMLRNLK